MRFLWDLWVPGACPVTPPPLAGVLMRLGPRESPWSLRDGILQAAGRAEVWASDLAWNPGSPVPNSEAWCPFLGAESPESPEWVHCYVPKLRMGQGAW